MNNATPELRKLVRRLAAHHASALRRADPNGSGSFQVCEQLREPLSRLTGAGGFRSLLSRALALAGREVAWLQSMRVTENGSLSGLEDLEPKPEPRAMAEGEVVLTAQVLGLLVIFIGPALTNELLRNIWPELPALNVGWEKHYEDQSGPGGPVRENRETHPEGQDTTTAHGRSRAR